MKRISSVVLTLCFSFVLTIFCSINAFAKKPGLFFCKVTIPALSNLTDSLIADSNFNELAVVAFDIHKVISEKNTFDRFSKYLRNSISKSEKDRLLKAFGFIHEFELNSIINKYFRLLAVTQQKYPGIIENINRSKVSFAAETILKNYNSRLTLGDCWVSLLTWNSACYSYCANQDTYDYYSCVWACIDTGLLIYSACWMVVEI